MVRINGPGTVAGQVSREEARIKIHLALLPILKAGLHSIEISIVRDPNRIKERLFDEMQRKLVACQTQQIDLEAMIRDQNLNHSRIFTSEEVLLTLYTRSAWTSRSGKSSGRLKKEEVEASQSLDALQNHHASLDALCRNLRVQGHIVKILDSMEYGTVLRRGLYPDRDGFAAGDCLPRDEGDDRKQEQSLDWMLSTDNAVLAGHDSVVLGDCHFVGVDVHLGPETLLPFDDLIAAMHASAKTMPWRCTFKIDASPANAYRLKEHFIRLFGFTHPDWNQKIQTAFDFMKEWKEDNEVPVRLRMSFATWVSRNEELSLRQGSALLRRVVEQWGNTVTDRTSGDHLATVLSTIPGFSMASTATTALAPLEEVLELTPLNRTTSPWAKGEVLFCSDDGVCWPYQRGSSLQTNWLEVIIGNSGSGKSVAMSAFNLNTILHGLDQRRPHLPDIAIIDVGNSSQGLIRMLQEALPPDRKTEALHMELKMTAEHAINIFDTPLGFRQPLNRHRSFLVSFLSIIAGSADSVSQVGLSGIIGTLVDTAYAQYSDRSSPKRYYSDADSKVDQTLRMTGFDQAGHTTWWEVVDWLQLQGHTALASRAQTHAMPVLSDLILACHAPQVLDLYANSGKTEGETVPSVVGRIKQALSEASRDYPILAGPTKFDLGSARVVALDIAQVLTFDRHERGQKNAALMFMLASKVTTGAWGMNGDDVLASIASGGLPPEYEGHHLKRCQRSKSSVKLLCLDEYHRASGVPEVNDHILLEAREGRKRNIRITLASQFAGDFHPQLLELASTILVFGTQTTNAVNELGRYVPIPPELIQNMTDDSGKLADDGVSLVGIFKTKLGIFGQKLNLNLGPHELWEFSTTVEDVALRDKAYMQFGAAAGRRRLAAHFPRGSARDRIVSMMNYRVRQTNHVDSKHLASDAVADIVRELELIGNACGRGGGSP